MSTRYTISNAFVSSCNPNDAGQLGANTRSAQCLWHFLSHYTPSATTCWLAHYLSDGLDLGMSGPSLTPVLGSEHLETSESVSFFTAIN